MSTQPSGPTAADRSAGDAAALLPTATGATQPADHPAAGHVTAGEIAEFLRHLARFRSPAVGGDPADQRRPARPQGRAVRPDRRPARPRRDRPAVDGSTDDTDDT